MHDDINDILIELVNNNFLEMNYNDFNDILVNCTDSIQTVLLGGIENKGILKKNDDYDTLIMNELKDFIMTQFNLIIDNDKLTNNF
jgi:hypothetical protein